MNFISQNKTFTSVAVTFVVVLALLMGLQGCTLDRMIKHEVPLSLVELNRGESKVSIADSPFLRERFLSEVEITVRQFDSAAEDAALFAAIINSAVSFGVQDLGTSALPGGTAALGLLGMVGALFLPKPGTQRQLQEEKIASFNSGMERALKELKAPVQS